MSPDIAVIDPLTFRRKPISTAKAWDQYTNKFLQETASEAQKRLAKLKKPEKKLRHLGDMIVQRLIKPDSLWRQVPVDAKVPGCFASLADDALAAAPVGVALTHQCLKQGIDFATEYRDSELLPILNSPAGVVQVVRLACLLQKAGIPRSDLVSATEEAVKTCLTSAGIASSLAGPLAQLALSGQPGREPKTHLERVIAYAIHVAAQDWCVLSPQPQSLAQVLTALHGALKDDRLREVANVLAAETLPATPSQTARSLLPLDATVWKKRDQLLCEAPTVLGIDEKPLCVLLLEAEGIQGIVYRAEALKTLVGFSALIEEGIQQATSVIQEELAPENVIFAGGGTLMAIIPAAFFDSLREKAVKRYITHLEGIGAMKAPGRGEWVACSLAEIKNGPTFTWEIKVDEAANLTWRSFAQLYRVALQTLTSGVLSMPGEVHLEPDEMCTICRLERFKSTDILPGERVGSICEKAIELRHQIYERSRQLRIRIDKSGTCTTITDSEDSALDTLPSLQITRGAIDQLCQLLTEELKLETNKPLLQDLIEKQVLKLRLVESVNHLGRQLEVPKSDVSSLGDDLDEETLGKLAVVIGDGDNFGIIKASMVSLTQYRKVSQIFTDVLTQGLATALAPVLLAQIKLMHEKKVLGDELELPFLVVYAGGDDFLLFLDVGGTLLFLKGFQDFLTQQFGERLESYTLGQSIQFLGMSMGIAVVDQRTPIYSALEAVTELKDEAKRRSKEDQGGDIGSGGSKRKSVFGSGITVAIHRFTGLPSQTEASGLFEVHPILESKVVHTAWPRTATELFGSDGLTSLLHQLLAAEINVGVLKRVFRGWKDKIPAEFSLIIADRAKRVARSSEKQTTGLKAAKVDAYKALEERVFAPSRSGQGNIIRYAFPDVIELLQIISQKELIPR